MTLPRRGSAAALGLALALSCPPEAGAIRRDLDLVEHVTAAQVVVPTSRIDFGTTEARRSRALRSGWLTDEQNGTATYVWATGKRASTRFFRLTSGPGELEMRIYVPPAPVEMTVSVNGHEISKRSPPPGWHVLSAAVPADVLRPGENSLEFGFVGSFRETYGQHRDLTIAFDWVDFHDTAAVSEVCNELGATRFRDRKGRLRLPPGTGIVWLVRPGARAVLQLEVAGDLRGGKPLTAFLTPLEGGESVALDLHSTDAGPDRFEAPLPARSGATMKLLLANETSETLVVDEAILRRGPPERPSSAWSPSIVVLVLDALRADHVHALGYGRDTTPCIDRFAKRAVTFTNAFSQGPMTIVSMASFLTGTEAPDHGVRPETRLRETPPTVAERLHAVGYRTALVTANPFLGHAFGLDRGFGEVRELFETVSPVARGADGVVPAPLVSRAAVDLLLVEDDSPLFLLAHYLQPHAPYAPPVRRWGRCGVVGEEFDGREHFLTKALKEGPAASAALRQAAIDCYDDNLLYVDREVCHVVEQISLLGLEESTAIVVTSDHGEEFLEHGTFGHPREHLFDESIHVPLFVRVPGVEPHDVNSLVALVDLSATLLDLGGVAKSVRRGESLMPLLRAAAIDSKRRSVHSFGPLGRRPDGGWRSAIRTAKYKLIRGRDGNPEMIFDLDEDAGEQRNVVGKPPERADGLESELDEIWRAADATAEPAVIPEGVRSQLQALGYVEDSTGP